MSFLRFIVWGLCIRHRQCVPITTVGKMRKVTILYSLAIKTTHLDILLLLCNQSVCDIGSH